MSSETPQIAIYAHLSFDGSSGGIEHFVLSLIRALGELDGPERYTILTSNPTPEALEAVLGPNQEAVIHRDPGVVTATRAGRSIFQRLGGVFKSKDEAPYKGRERRIPPQDQGFLSSLGFDLIHFPYQWIIQSDVPTVYNPHDLQHRHHPEFFSEDELDTREKIHSSACRLARAVVAESSWGKVDLVRQYGMTPDKVHTIFRGSPTESYDAIQEQDLIDAKQQFGLPDSFALYPAQAWPHKNHIRLVEAIKLLEDQHGVVLPVVFTGRPNDYQAEVQKKIDELGLTERVRFLGYVSSTELRALYKLCRFVVFPSLFEGGGFPIVEAFYEGAAVACSAITSLPEYGGDAVCSFDPTSVESIASAMHRVESDEGYRDGLRDRGRERVKQFSWEQTAHAYRGLYRHVLGYPQSEQDRLALANGGRRQAVSQE